MIRTGADPQAFIWEAERENGAMDGARAGVTADISLALNESMQNAAREGYHSSIRSMIYGQSKMKQEET